MLSFIPNLKQKLCKYSQFLVLLLTNNPLRNIIYYNGTDTSIRKDINMAEKNYNAKTAKENNLIGRKIAQKRKCLHLTQGELIKRLVPYGVEVQQAAVTKWENGINTPTSYQMIAICLALNAPDIITELTDTTLLPDIELNEPGLKKLDEYRELLIASGKYKPVFAEKAASISTITVPTSYIRAAAGAGNLMDEENFEDKEYPAGFVPDGTDFALYVDGNSMSPVYVNDQIVFVKQCETISPGQVGIFSVDNEVVIKIYDEQEPDESVRDEFTDGDGNIHSQVVLRSYNSDWKPRAVSPYQEFRVYGRVLN